MKSVVYSVNNVRQYVPLRTVRDEYARGFKRQHSLSSCRLSILWCVQRTFCFHQKQLAPQHATTLSQYLIGFPTLMQCGEVFYMTFQLHDAHVRRGRKLHLSIEAFMSGSQQETHRFCTKHALNRAFDCQCADLTVIRDYVLRSQCHHASTS